ncbi:MAG: LssY C-terminal domain-containing protein [Desulforhopalus sp.]
MMHNLLNLLLPSIEHVHFTGYWVAFFSALLETTVGIGLLLPGSTIILFLGGLSSRGYLDTGDLIWFAVAGAILGDNINYYLGQKYGTKWLDKGLWFFKSDYIAKTKTFMDKHGAKSVFLGRFVPSAKEVVPFIAGSVNMNRKTFIFWNVLGAIGWGLQWVLAGYIFAQSLSLAELWLSRTGLFLAFLVILGAILYLFKWLVINKGKQFWDIVVSLWQSITAALMNNEYAGGWAKRHPGIISFLKARFDTTSFSGLPLSLCILAFAYALTLFAGLVEDFLTSDPIIAADTRIADLVPDFRTNTLTKIFTWVTLLGDSRIVLGCIVVSVAILCLWHKKYYCYSLVIAVCGSMTFTYLGKLVFHRPRPQQAVYVEHSFSFPSGHATIAVAFYGFLAYLLMRHVQSWNIKINVLFATILLILAIGLSRVYLGEHYTSDVWSGYLVGFMWLVIAVSWSEWLKSKNKGIDSIGATRGARPISIVLLFIAILFYGGFAIYYHPELASAPKRNRAVVSKSVDIFTDEKIKYTETLFGEEQEPINVICLAKDNGQLIAALRDAGWMLTDKTTIPSLLKTGRDLLLKTPHSSAPVSPSFWNGRVQDFSFAKVSGFDWWRNAHHLKIWNSNSLLKNGRIIYLGLVNANDGFKWGIFPKINPDLDTERESLYLDLDHAGKIQGHHKVQLVKPLIGKNFIGDQFFTDGKAYILSVQ